MDHSSDKKSTDVNRTSWWKACWIWCCCSHPPAKHNNTSDLKERCRESNALNSYDILHDCTTANTEPFHALGRYHAKVVQCLDGDTVTVAMLPTWLAGNSPRLFRIRMAGIDAPEMHPKNKSHEEAEAEKAAAVRSRDALWVRVRDSTEMTVEILEQYTLPSTATDAGTKSVHPPKQKMTRKNHLGYDKFGGRFVGVLRDGEVDINRWMVEQGHAVLYDGGRKLVQHYATTSSSV